MIGRYAYLWWRNRHVSRFLAGAKDARRIQRQVLFSKLRRNAESDFGREHGFSTIESVADFRRRMPITTYDYYRPYIERVKRGEFTAMFGSGSRVLMFALTSGTTDHAKFIPITQEFLSEYRQGWNLWGVRTYIDHMKLVHLKTMQLTSNWRQFQTEAGIPCGNISGLAAETAPLVSRRIFIVPRALMRIPDPAAKLYTTLRLTLPYERVGMIMTANPSTLVELARMADSQQESLVRDLRDGTISEQFNLPHDVRRALSGKLLKRHPARAQELERIIEMKGSLFPRDFWPKMEVLGVWTGGSVGAYLPRVREYYGDMAVRDHGLSASEGRLTIPFSDETTAGVTDYVTQYFEFIPEAEHGRKNPTILEGHELELDQKYFVLLTTSSGFYRYDIHDLVRCVGFEGTAPILEFLNKGAHFCNVTGEKLSEFQVVSAVQRGFSDLGLKLELFTVAPRWGDPPRYVLLTEGQSREFSHKELALRIDTHLASLNCEYANRLETGRLRPLAVQEIPPGTWAKYRRSRINRRGGSLEQYKHPCLLNDFEFLDKLRRISPMADLAATG